MIKPPNAVRCASFIRHGIAQYARFPTKVLPMSPNITMDGPGAVLRRPVYGAQVTRDYVREMIESADAVRGAVFIRDGITDRTGFPAEAGPMVLNVAMDGPCSSLRSPI